MKWVLLSLVSVVAAVSINDSSEKKTKGGEVGLCDNSNPEVAKAIADKCASAKSCTNVSIFNSALVINRV